MVTLPPPDPVHQGSQGEPRTRQLVGGPQTETRIERQSQYSSNNPPNQFPRESSLRDPHACIQQFRGTRRWQRRR
eukprot:scaffold25128_cov58-Attheya_sp.AAC.4